MFKGWIDTSSSSSRSFPDVMCQDWRGEWPRFRFSWGGKEEGSIPFASAKILSKVKTHNLSERIENALPVILYPQFKEACLRLASEIAAKRDDTVSHAVWQGMRDNRRLNDYLREAMVLLTGLSSNDLLDPSVPIDVDKVRKALRIQEAIWENATDKSESQLITK